MRLGALAKYTGALKSDREGASEDLAELGIKVAGEVFTHLAEETQGDVQGLGGSPAGAWNAGLAGRQGLSDPGRQGEGGEQADHAGLLSAK